MADTKDVIVIGGRTGLFDNRLYTDGEIVRGVPADFKAQWCKDYSPKFDVNGDGIPDDEEGRGKRKKQRVTGSDPENLI